MLRLKDSAAKTISMVLIYWREERTAIFLKMVFLVVFTFFGALIALQQKGNIIGYSNVK